MISRLKDDLTELTVMLSLVEGRVEITDYPTGTQRIHTVQIRLNDSPYITIFIDSRVCRFYRIRYKRESEYRYETYEYDDLIIFLQDFLESELIDYDAVCEDES